MKYFTEQIHWGSGAKQNISNSRKMHKQLSEAISLASGLQQGILVTDPEYIKGTNDIKKILNSISIGLGID